MQLQISVSNSSRFNAETMAYQTDKGTGIKEMIAHFGIHQEETLLEIATMIEQCLNLVIIQLL